MVLEAGTVPKKGRPVSNWIVLEVNGGRELTVSDATHKEGSGANNEGYELNGQIARCLFAPGQRFLRDGGGCFLI